MRAISTTITGGVGRGVSRGDSGSAAILLLWLFKHALDGGGRLARAVWILDQREAHVTFA
jgi:hypothetical protein